MTDEPLVEQADAYKPHHLDQRAERRVDDSCQLVWRQAPCRRAPRKSHVDVRVGEILERDGDEVEEDEHRQEGARHGDGEAWSHIELRDWQYLQSVAVTCGEPVYCREEGVRRGELEPNHGEAEQEGGPILGLVSARVAIKKAFLIG